MRELWRAAESSAAGIELFREQLAARFQRRIRKLDVGCARWRIQVGKGRHERGVLGAKIFLVVPVVFRDPQQNVAKGRKAVTRFTRKIRAPEEGLPIVVC